MSLVQKPTNAGAAELSAKCQKRTLRQIHVVSALRWRLGRINF